MKTNVLKLLGLAIMLYLSGCEGKQGEVGPAGKDGTNGINGKDGVNGTNGNANVVYTDWKTPVWVAQTDPSYNTSNFVNFKQESNAFPLFTQEVIDKAVIYIYIKYKELYSENGKYSLREVIEPNSSSIQTTSYFKIPERTTNNASDYSIFQIFTLNKLSVNNLTILSSLSISTNPFSNNSPKIPELMNKSLEFYNNFTKNLYSYRVVIIYGSIKGRLAGVNMNDYAEVKKALNLKD